MATELAEFEELGERCASLMNAAMTADGDGAMPPIERWTDLAEAARSLGRGGARSASSTRARRGAGAAGAGAFREQYMATTTAVFADELDALRQSKDFAARPRDIAYLIDTLAAGKEAFNAAERELFVAAFGDDQSAGASADGAADGDNAAPAESPDDGDAPRDDGEAASPAPSPRAGEAETGKSGPKRQQQKRSARGSPLPSPKTKKRK